MQYAQIEIDIGVKVPWQWLPALPQRKDLPGICRNFNFERQRSIFSCLFRKDSFGHSLDFP
jgi:hypothetical protein